MRTFPHESMMSSLLSIYRVWRRYFAVFQKDLWYGLVTTFVEPFLYLASFGFGLGGLIGTLNIGGQSVSYRAFVLAGIVGQTVLFQGFFEASYGSFIRMYYQKIFQAIVTTPITLSEVLWGELFWDASRATLSAGAVLMMGVISRDFSLVGAILALPLCFFSALIFASLGMLVAAKSQTIESISYPQYLFIFPMFLFCGVFYPLSQLPPLLQKGISLLPLAPILSLFRTLLLGFPFEPFSIVVILGWGVIIIPLARSLMTRRLVA